MFCFPLEILSAGLMKRDCVKTTGEAADVCCLFQFKIGS